MNLNNIKNKLDKNIITLISVALVYAIICILTYSEDPSRQLLSLIIPVSVYVILAVSLNLVVGFLGELSLGHAGFMSVGLFSGCIASVYMANLSLLVRLPLAILIGGLCAAVVGLIIGLPVLRLRGDYLAIVTLACGEIIKNIFTNLKIKNIDFDGALGFFSKKVDTITGESRYNILSDAKTLLPYAIVLVFLTIIAVMNLKKSRHGRAIMAIRDNRIAAESVGINVTYYKLIVFVIAAFFAGAAGVIYGYSFANTKAALFDYNMSIEILVIVVLGGMGNIPGSIIAAVILKVLPEVLRDMSNYRMLVYSIVLIFLMLFNESPKFAELKRKLSIRRLFLKLKKNKEGTADAK